jgi:hypothetical protein
MFTVKASGAFVLSKPSQLGLIFEGKVTSLPMEANDIGSDLANIGQDWKELPGRNSCLWGRLCIFDLLVLTSSV